MVKNCALILVYFGKFNSYFDLFLKSCSKNSSYDWIIFTDNCESYEYPKNVHVIMTSLFEVKSLAERKFGFPVSLDTPYKLCDYKPTYGFLFEEYLQEYQYWGHCDCDLLFGNLDTILTPIIEQGYDKIFAAGHLTLYKNTSENNRRFMKPHDGKEIYKEALSTPQIYVFDEDFQSKHHNDNNVHSIFLEDGARIFAEDVSMNVSSVSAKFIRSAYNPIERKFVRQNYIPARYYWDQGNLFSLNYNSQTKDIETREYLYIHLQSRKMRNKVHHDRNLTIEILSDRFISKKRIPHTRRGLREWTIGVPYLFWFDVYWKKVKRCLHGYIVK